MLSSYVLHTLYCKINRNNSLKTALNYKEAQCIFITKSSLLMVFNHILSRNYSRDVQIDAFHKGS